MTDRPAFKKAHADQVAHFAASTPPPGADKLKGPREVKEAEKAEAAE